MFLIRKSKITIDCFTDSPLSVEQYPVDKSVKFVPEEWKRLPTTVEVKANPSQTSNLTVSVPTIKRCQGIIDLYSRGFIVPAWTDFSLEMLGERQINAHDAGKKITLEYHGRELYWPDLYKGSAHVKINNPWFFKEKSGVSFLWNQCDWVNTNILRDFKIVTGVLNFKYQHIANINAFQKVGSIVKFSAGDPLIQLIPLSEKEVDIKCHLLSDTEYQKLKKECNDRATYSGHYRNKKAFMDKQSKCPFSGWINK